MRILLLLFFVALAGACLLDAPAFPGHADPGAGDSTHVTLLEPSLPDAPLLPAVKPTAPQPELARQVTDRLMGRRRRLHTLMEACDYRHDGFRLQVARIVQPENARSFNLGAVCDLFDYLNQVWAENDSAADPDEPRPASASMKSRRGNSTQYAVTLCSALLATGGTAAIQLGECAGNARSVVWVCLRRDIDLEAVREYLHARYGNYACKLWRDPAGHYWLNLDLGHVPGASPCFDGGGTWLFPQLQAYGQRR